MTVEKGEEQLVSTAVEAIDAHASARYRVWLPSGAVSADQVEEIRSRLSKGTVEALSPVSFPGISTGSDAMQALLPALFADHERLVVVPAAAEVTADVIELSHLKFGDDLIAAKHDVRKSRSSGLTLMRRIASGFGDDHVGALNFVFASHAGLNEDFIPFDPQIAVLNLDGLRRERVAEQVLGLLKDVSISYIDAMQVAIGGRYTAIDPEWNIRAQWEASDSPKIVNWRRQTRHYGQMALNG